MLWCQSTSSFSSPSYLYCIAAAATSNRFRFSLSSFVRSSFLREHSFNLHKWVSEWEEEKTPPQKPTERAPQIRNEQHVGGRRENDAIREMGFTCGYIVEVRMVLAVGGLRVRNEDKSLSHLPSPPQLDEIPLLRGVRNNVWFQIGFVFFFLSNHLMSSLGSCPWWLTREDPIAMVDFDHVVCRLYTSTLRRRYSTFTLSSSSSFPFDIPAEHVNVGHRSSTFVHPLCSSTSFARQHSTNGLEVLGVASRTFTSSTWYLRRTTETRLDLQDRLENPMSPADARPRWTRR